MVNVYTIFTRAGQRKSIITSNNNIPSTITNNATTLQVTDAIIDHKATNTLREVITTQHIYTKLLQ